MINQRQPTAHYCSVPLVALAIRENNEICVRRLESWVSLATKKTMASSFREFIYFSQMCAANPLFFSLYLINFISWQVHADSFSGRRHLNDSSRNSMIRNKKSFLNFSETQLNQNYPFDYVPLVFLASSVQCHQVVLAKPECSYSTTAFRQRSTWMQSSFWIRRKWWRQREEWSKNARTINDVAVHRHIHL